MLRKDPFQWAAGTSPHPLIQKARHLFQGLPGLRRIVGIGFVDELFWPGRPMIVASSNHFHRHIVVATFQCLAVTSPTENLRMVTPSLCQAGGSLCDDEQLIVFGY